MPAKPWAIVTAACGPGPSGTNSQARSVTLPSTTNSTSRCSAMISLPELSTDVLTVVELSHCQRQVQANMWRVWLCGASISSRSSLVGTVQEMARHVRVLHDCSSRIQSPLHEEQNGHPTGSQTAAVERHPDPGCITSAHRGDSRSAAITPW